jgi:phospholipase D1/2
LLLLEPERPVGVEQLEQMMAVELPSEEGRRTLVRPVLAVLMLLFLGGLWYSTPLRDWVTPKHVAALAEPLRHGSAGPFVWASIFVVAGMLMVPLTGLIVASALLFGPNLGAAISLVAGVASAAGGYLMGRWLWRDTLRRFAGPRLSRISREVGERGIVSIVAVRLVPIAPFTVVNMVAGASHVGLRDFVVGSALGMAPGIAGISILSNRAAALVTDPGAGSLAMLLVVALVFGAALVWLRRRFVALGSK